MPRKWTRAHEAQLKRILQLMHIEARPFADSSPDAVARRKALPFDDWCHTYLPHYFYCPSASAHLIADDLVEEEGIPTGLKWGRGMAKSVRYGLAKPIHWTVNRLRHFIVHGGRTEDVATDKLDLIKLELQHNARLRQDYGEEIGPSAGANEDADWIACDTRFLARGIGQSPRGLLYRQFRPDVFIGDDLEDDIIARNPEREKELWDWIFSSVWYALEGAGTKAVCVLLLNTFGRNSLAARMAEKSKELDKTGRQVCRLVVFPAEDENGNSTWPARYSNEALARAQAVSGTRLYRKEMRCIDDDESAAFRPEWIKSFDAAAFLREHRDQCEIRVAVDASAKAKEISDFKAVVALARPIGSADYYCVHAFIRRVSAMELMERIIWVSDTFSPGRIGCEEVGFQTLLWPLLETTEQLKGRLDRIGMFPIASKGAKEDRILSDVTAFEQGHVFFDVTEGDQKLLVDMYLDYGKPGVLDDGPDAFNMARSLFPKIASARSADLFQTEDDARRENFDALVNA